MDIVAIREIAVDQLSISNFPVAISQEKILGSGQFHKTLCTNGLGRICRKLINGAKNSTETELSKHNMAISIVNW